MLSLDEGGVQTLRFREHAAARPEAMETQRRRSSLMLQECCSSRQVGWLGVWQSNQSNQSGPLQVNSRHAGHTPVYSSQLWGVEHYGNSNYFLHMCCDKGYGMPVCHTKNWLASKKCYDAAHAYPNDVLYRLGMPPLVLGGCRHLYTMT